MDGGQTERSQLLRELQGLMADAHGATDLQVLKSIYYRVQAIGQEHSSDQTMQRAVTEIKGIVVARGQTLKEAGATGVIPFATSALPATTPAAPAMSPVPTPPEMQSPTPPVPLPPAAPPPPPPVSRPSTPNLGSLRPKPNAAPPPSMNWKMAVLAGSALAVALVAGALVFLKKGGGPAPNPPVSSTGIVNITTVPPGASILIDGKPHGKSDAKLDLRPGQYELQAVLDGYEPAARTFAISPGTPLNLNLILRPANNTLRLMADMEGGSATLDGQAAPLQAGQAVLDKVTPGTHTLKVTGAAGQATLQFETPAGEMPRATALTNVKNFLPIVIANLGGQAHIQSNATKPVKIAMDGKPAGELVETGLDLKDVTPGDHELTWGEGSEQKKLIVHFGPAPSITMHLKLDLNAGTLLVITGEDKAKVTLNGKPYSLPTSHGQLRIPNLGVQTYTVSVSKDGYQAVPEQKVQIKKGEESRLQFTMKALPQVAVLRIEGAPAGTTVTLDSEKLGAVQSDGFFSHSGINPGEHSVELRRDGFTPKSYRKTFTAGQAVAMTGSEVLLEPLPGTVKVVVTPANAQVAYRKSGEAQLTPINGGTVSLTEGSYTIVAKAAGFNEQGQSVTVAPGKTSTVEISLNAERAPLPTKPAAMGMNAFEAPNEWKKQEEWLVHRGGNYVLLKPATTFGTLSFSASLLKGGGVLRGAALEWVLHFANSKNFILYKLDKKNFTRNVTVNGKGADVKQPNPLDDPDTVSLVIQVEPHKIVHSIRVGDKQTVLDTYVNQTTDLTEGRFGFHIQGSDEVGLAHFSYQPQQ